MNSVEELFKSWKIVYNPDETNFDIASKRIVICDSCEFKDVIQLPNPDPQIVEYLTRCKVCGCALRSKMFTSATYRDPGGSCPHNKWMEVEKEWLETRETLIADIRDNNEQKISLDDSYLIEDYVKEFSTYDGINYHNLILPIPSKNNNFLSNRKDTSLAIKCGSTWSMMIQNYNTDLPNSLTIQTGQIATFIYDGEKWIYQK